MLRALGLGDLLTGVPALRAIRAAFPLARITLAAPSVLAPLAELSGAVDEVADTAPLRPLDESLSEPDLAVDLHGRGPESTRLLLAARPRRLIAFAHADIPQTTGMPRWVAGEHEVTRWCRLVRGFGMPADPADLRLARPGVPSPCPGAIVIHPGAASGARRWPPDRWATVARALRLAPAPSSAPAPPLVVTGGAGERALAERVAELAGLPELSVLAGRTSLTELAALVARASVVLSGDTGVAHLAAAYATPAVTLAGPVPPLEWGPPRRPWHRVLWTGGRGDPHADEPDPGLLAITVDEVLAAARAVAAAI